jgi:hypothetical protein
MLHIRDIINYSYTVSSNALIRGTETVWVDVNINTLNGAGSFAGTIQLTPDALGGRGSWIGSFGGHLKGGRYDGDPLTRVDAEIVARGTGALSGRTIHFAHLLNEAYPHPEGPAGCTFDGEVFHGVIVDPA